MKRPVKKSVKVKPAEPAYSNPIYQKAYKIRQKLGSALNYKINQEQSFSSSFSGTIKK